MTPPLPPLREIWPLINSLDWTDPAFAREKAYVCALFSECAYWYIPEWELNSKGRIKIVPSHAYQELAFESGAGSDLIGSALLGADLQPPIIVARRYALIAAFRTPRVVFIAIRGTKCLYDWAINLNAARCRPNPASPTVLLHRGFYRAVSACFEELGDKLRQYLTENVVVYVSGHSLGGAMAAVMHAIWSVTVAREYVAEGVMRRQAKVTHSAFTFGMPRYGNFDAIAALRNPFHVYAEEDIVPAVPPRWLGFEDCPTEYRTDGLGLERASVRESVAFGVWLMRLFSGVGIRAHLIERYRRELNPTTASAARLN